MVLNTSCMELLMVLNTSCMELLMVLNTSCMELLMVLAVRGNGYSLDMYDCLWSYRERICGCVWSWLGGVLEFLCSWTGGALNCMVLNNCLRLKLGGVQGCIWSRLVCACLILGPVCLVVCDPWLGDDTVSVPDSDMYGVSCGPSWEVHGTVYGPGMGLYVVCWMSIVLVVMFTVCL